MWESSRYPRTWREIKVGNIYWGPRHVTYEANVKSFTKSYYILVLTVFITGKEEKDCMFEQTGLGLFIFDENKLIAVHDYERSFPAVLDIYKFW